MKAKAGMRLKSLGISVVNIKTLRGLESGHGRLVPRHPDTETFCAIEVDQTPLRRHRVKGRSVLT